MKQAEHPPMTAGASIAAEYSLALIDQLARIDRTCSKEEMDELVYRLLAFVGGHLGSARENLRMLTLLEEKQKSLEQNLQAVKLEQQMLKVLCRDSTSVYRVDLMNDRAEIVKIEESTPTPRATCSRMGRSYFPMPRRSSITITSASLRRVHRTSCNFWTQKI